MRVLSVENESILGTAIKQALSYEAYIVDWVTDGQEAQYYLEDKLQQYTLAIFDWSLPGLSGVNLCKWLRKQNNPLPVLMLTKD